MSKFEKAALTAVVLLLAVQFIQPEKNQGDYQLKSFLAETQPSNTVKTMLFNACFDCHSNNTQYPWYFQITPLNFRIAHHIEEGKEHLNFSEWSSYNKDQKDHALEEIIEVMEKKEMPLKTYVWLHNEGKLTDAQSQMIIDWAKEAKSK
ncbi:heme-binding domain-containing protein [Tenacibaculum sp. IB213877]|uniref:heme-binding domain-containing protein n=1 Tax=Tenacibaculum sp. IB213877 TaxID=3097351 RepID=UPI002A599A25|nr:heme-binding domain-containing protein [Tenacibaculum sp. IB213877]MDY0780209.1 heme-binding domain-containing protein [Tenacibaculum sp. IB213877]